MAEINDLNVVDASNVARFPENQAPSTVNDGGRALEGIHARWHKDTNGSLVSTGTSTAYAVAANQTLSAYYDGLEIVFDAHVTCGTSPTLNVDSVAAATLKKFGDQDLASGDIEAGQKVAVVYDGTNWQVQTPLADSKNYAVTNANNNFTADQTIDVAGIADFRVRSSNNSGFPVEWYMAAHDSAGSDTDYVNLTLTIVDNTAGAEDGEFTINTIQNGSLSTVVDFRQGIDVGNATGGDQGSGTLNASEIYDDGVQIHPVATETATATTSGTSHDYTGIRSDAVKITVSYSGTSTSGSSIPIIQIGDSGGIENSNYLGSTSNPGSQVNWSSGARLVSGHASTSVLHGILTLALVDSSTNTWAISGTTGRSDATQGYSYGGTKSLSGTLTQLRLTTENGTDTFNAGTLNIIVE